MANAKVSGLLGIAALILSANGCGEASDPTETVTGAILNRWTPQFSDEGYPNGGYQNCNAFDDQAVVMGINCQGRYCDNMKLYCAHMPAGFTDTYPPAHGSVSGYISEEAPNNIQYCPRGSIMYGLAATGSFSDNIQLDCRTVNFPPQGLSCVWSPWVSEEQGTMYFDASPYKPGLGVAIAVMCNGSYCDNMSFLVCESQCTSNADCGVNACVNGSCVIP